MRTYQKIRTTLLAVLLMLAAGPAAFANKCETTGAHDLFFGEYRMVAYEIIAEPKFAEKMADKHKKLNEKIEGETVADYEFSDQVHRVITTALIERENSKPTPEQKQELFDSALEEAYHFNLEYARREK